MRNKTRLLGAVVVIGAAVIAACWNHAKESSTEQRVVTVTPMSYDFGAVMINTTVTSPAFTVAPQGLSEDDQITLIDASSCTEFGLVLPPPLPGSAAHVFNMCAGSGSQVGSTMPAFGGATYGDCVPVTYSFQATFKPTTAQATSCLVRVHYQPVGGGSGSVIAIMLSGSGALPPFAMAVTPSSAPFGDVPVGQSSSTTTVTVRNTGGNPLFVSGTNSEPAAFVVTPVGSATLVGHTLNPGLIDQFDVRCSPTSPIPYSGTLTFTTSQGPSGSVSLSCNGIDSQIGIEPSPARFTTTLVGRAAPALAVTITNPGTLLTINKVELSADTSPEVTITTSPQGTQVGSGQTRDVVLAFSGATAKPFGPLGTLVIGVEGSPDRNVTITGEALTAGIGTNPPSHDFGPICVGEMVEQDFAVFASGEGGVQLTSVTAPGAPWAVTTPAGALGGNHTTEISVNVKLTPDAAGELSDMFVLNSDVPTDPAHPVMIEALALPIGVAATPDLVRFGGAMAQVPVLKELEISNCSNSPIEITDAAIQGANLDEFTIVEPLAPQMTLNHMDSTTFRIVMTGRTNGVKAAQLVVTYDDGSTAVANLEGNVFGGDDDDVDDRATYYACSTGGRGGGWAVGLVVLALLRRRRR